MERFQRYNCKIQIRPEFEGRKIKPGCKILDGRSFVMMVIWRQHKRDSYPGEYALEPCSRRGKRLFDEARIMWISSGDVVVREAG